MPTGTSSRCNVVELYPEPPTHYVAPIKCSAVRERSTSITHTSTHCRQKHPLAATVHGTRSPGRTGTRYEYGTDSGRLNPTENSGLDINEQRTALVHRIYDTKTALQGVNFSCRTASAKDIYNATVVGNRRCNGGLVRYDTTYLLCGFYSEKGWMKRGLFRVDLATQSKSPWIPFLPTKISRARLCYSFCDTISTGQTSVHKLRLSRQRLKQLRRTVLSVVMHPLVWKSSTNNRRGSTLQGITAGGKELPVPSPYTVLSSYSPCHASVRRICLHFPPFRSFAFSVLLFRVAG